MLGSVLHSNAITDTPPWDSERGRLRRRRAIFDERAGRLSTNIDAGGPSMDSTTLIVIVLLVLLLGGGGGYYGSRAGWGGPHYGGGLLGLILLIVLLLWLTGNLGGPRRLGPRVAHPDTADVRT